MIAYPHYFFFMDYIIKHNIVFQIIISIFYFIHTKVEFLIDIDNWSDYYYIDREHFYNNKWDTNHNLKFSLFTDSFPKIYIALW